MFRNCFSHTRPDNNIRAMNELLVSLTIGERRQEGTEDSSKWGPANDLLSLDNGNWTNPRKIQHYCKGMFCCPGGIQETRAKIWTAVLAACSVRGMFVLYAL